MNYRWLWIPVLLFVAAVAWAGGQGEAAAAGEAGVPTIQVFSRRVVETDIGEMLLSDAEEEVGINVEFEEVPSQNYAERLQILLASGDYPDMIFFRSKDRTLIDAARDGVIIPLNQYLDNAPALVEGTLDATWKSMELLQDGDIYVIPRNTIARADGYKTRRDWVEAVGLEWPQDSSLTIDEFTEWIRRFEEDDPDGNGEDDTTGVFFHTAPDGTFGRFGGNNTPLYWPFGVLGWQKYGTEYMNLMYSRDMPNMKQALAYMNEIYEAGYTNPDMVVANRDQGQDKWNEGRVGMLNGFGGREHQFNVELQEIIPDANVDYLVGIENEDGEVYGSSYGTGVWGYWTVSSSSEHPQKVVDFANWALGDGWERIKWGYEGVTYEVNENGQKVLFQEAETEDGETGDPFFGAFVRRAEDVEFFVRSTPPEARPTAMENIQRALDAFVVSKDLGYVPDAALEQEFIEADEQLHETIGKIVIGELPVDAYDDALDDWYANGGAEYVAEMQEYIRSVWE